MPTKKTKKIAVYVDGYNLYEAMRDAADISKISPKAPKEERKKNEEKLNKLAYRGRLLWCRLDKLAACCLSLKEHGEVTNGHIEECIRNNQFQINFYTAPPPADKELGEQKYDPERYDNWTTLQANLRHKVIEGYFPVREDPKTSKKYVDKEKYTDVNLAVDMISDTISDGILDVDGVRHPTDTAILISGDTDFKRVVSFIHNLNRMKQIKRSRIKKIRKLYVLGVAQKTSQNAGWFNTNHEPDKKNLMADYDITLAELPEQVDQLNAKFCQIGINDIVHYCLEHDEIHFAGKQPIKAGHPKDSLNQLSEEDGLPMETAEKLRQPRHA